MDAAKVDPAESVSRIEETAREGWEIWSCALDAYTSYLAALIGARGAADVLAANSRFAVDSAGICTRAAADRQRWRGVATPTLNDA